ncbi:MAG: hypothetical protein QWI73_04920 [Alphaproteobacteria bacterium]|nr:hypothetical protein [Alphaproteobacteria bacterium]
MAAVYVGDGKDNLHVLPVHHHHDLPPMMMIGCRLMLVVPPDT